jgi:hypothetical protein
VSVRGVLVLAAFAALLTGDAAAQVRTSLFPKEGCSSLSRTNPCDTRRPPSPLGDPTDGPLTDSTRRGPLDPKPDPLGLDAELETLRPIEPQLLPSQQQD